MKCDVCGTQIPIGSNECPNCGYKYRTSSTNTYDASSQNHQHIKTGYEKMKTTYQKSSYPTKQYHFPIKSLAISLGSVFSIIFILLFIIPFIIGIIEGIQEVTHLGIFEQTIEEGYLDDGTVALALREEDQLVDLFTNQMMLEDVEVDEYVNDQVSYASVSVYGFDGDDYYELSAHYSENQCIDREITFIWDSKESIQQGQVSVNRDLWKYLAEYTGINAYEYFNQYRTQMVLEDDEYIYSESNVYDIFISETKENGYYSIYYNISNIWAND